MLIFLVVVALLLVAADRIGVAVAERKVASKVQSSQNLANRPSVTIEGFPFLTQVIRNHYHAVRLTAKDLTVGTGNDRIQISALAARLTGVRATGDYSGVTAQSVQGTATVSYQQLSQVVGVSLGYAGAGSDGAGRVQAARTVSAFGKSVTATVSASVNVSDGDQLKFSAVKVGVSDAGVSLPQQVTDQLTSIFAKQLSLHGLPFQLRVTSLVAGPTGVAVSAAASNVTLG